MGRSRALPPAIFAAIDPVRRIPRNNVIFVGVVALLGAFVIDYGLGAELLNFGALIAFIGVNVAALVRYYVREPRKKLGNLLPPLFGALICFVLWLNLTTKAKIVGGVWLLVGVAFGAWKTRGFRGDLVSFDVPPDTE
jgi:amino acid transporter